MFAIPLATQVLSAGDLPATVTMQAGRLRYVHIEAFALEWSR